ncbi:IclR family transcriptional regulator [Fictibacillus terranigra]|uniref:IclR family transcriptional regulator n=1 Tax=Fictibacillus terranigra TaxID=3058424 RepID=A0ABT8EBX6_9BACL|nr:IclR family transcriptional regulator [Fictibacillus sp. CENA-BCM004]MDN4075423.1 IclR family transcriptional regulator [Fictibacillus sp. CENA-BCM004]
MSVKTEGLSSVHNAIRILQTFSLLEPELGISELSVRLGLAKSTVYRLIKTLNESNLVAQNKETQKYHLGIAAFELGFTVYHSMELRKIALPILEKLSASLRKVVRLAVYDNGGVVYLCKCIHDEDNGTISKIGERAPSHCTAIGKMLLAYQNEQEIDHVLNGYLSAYTSKTITSPIHLKEQIFESKQKGYAITREELREGISSVAVPVYNDFAKMIASISVTGSNFYFKPDRVKQYVKEMRNCSRLITERLGMGY